MKELNNMTHATAILFDQLKDAHNNLQSTFEGVTEEVAHYQPPEKANPIAGTYAHLVFSEDFFIQMLIQGKTPMFDQDEWKDKTGASEVQPAEWENAYPKWLREVRLDLKRFQEYTNAVFNESEKYLESLTDEDLDKEIDMSAFGMDKRKVSSVLSGMVIGHCNNITGEISVLKGIQGLKGYPFYLLQKYEKHIDLHCFLTY